VTVATRDAFPDVLRGFALLGIALVNVPYFAIDTLRGAEGADLSRPANAAASFLVMALFQAKFYLLFSFLFGYSAHYVIKEERANRDRWVGRSIGLILLGILHFSLLFHGDILFLYGLFALLLWGLYFTRESTLRMWAWGIYIAGIVVLSTVALLTYVGERFLASKGEALPAETFEPSLNDALANGTFLGTIPARLELWLATAQSGFILQGPLVLAAFLVGVLVGRKNGLVDVNQSLMKKLIVIGLTLGLPLQLISAYLSVASELSDGSLGLSLLALAINFLTAPLLSAAYIGLLWFASERLKLALLRAAGRMSLSVYLSQSLIFSIIFSAWGLDLFAKLGVTEVTLIAAASWLLLAVFSLLYLQRFKKGPMEHVLTGFSKLFARKGSI
jgi:uncharacterized protein